ncbi:MAG TPA: phosphoenolpyruvate synthase [Candidatus Wildermuthbacteria bacterium]|uniref:Phosphoenolpyruvate synthase n=1 Tax=Candidatus Yanofskybacteria bacterium GW2011_GWC1_48_11 TaxID=1619027 RepID=A0A837IQJ3_9BACT|nr:MAG: Phosphoenolpyruvate synthase [Candidatus Yanofskybacteria bacterium GW2011_GWC1_48_11]KKW04028.1 MAG: Phosphoenolpyruvate synthase [Parcubacteria group bacterium GW2011_GWB1_49_12]KKW08871.1 MAG: Phosphoenolpyruvate synthase [Parcubacteria group bacterium GW2011_GWA1_49_26]KKW13725.1 MAG: Phosphoenolpyruvate synthase [Parcubacteria group bacterium GW2011_GWA2_50_10]OHA61793.1 MAG: phosphoenolpyruvate synthase [Candidatus Wildermuthbacteria bacterium GWA1_49_26]OHA65301.1 MAG: phosphoen
MRRSDKPFILWFEDIAIENVPQVGGKNAALGEMYAQLTPLGINIPNGFAISADAYRHFLDGTQLEAKIRKILSTLNTHNLKNLQQHGRQIRQLILQEELPADLREEIEEAYTQLGKLYGLNPDVAVRSSATAEDLPGASFAGQQETYLNVVGQKELLKAVKKAIASLFTDRAISYRQDKGFSHLDVALSVGVQKMVRSDLASSGVIFSIDTETGFDKVVVINASYGLGEMIVQGKVTPDEFTVFKPTLAKGYAAIIGQNLGKKVRKMIYAKKGIKQVGVLKKDQQKFCLSQEEILALANWTLKIENHFSKKHGRYQPMDIEWAKDGKTNKLFIVQARPETVHSTENKNVYKEYRMKEKGIVLASGAAVGTKIAQGKARVIKNVKDIGEFQKGEILVTEITDPDWEPIMKIAAAIVTDKGGRTSHAAIVSRELGIPSIVGTDNATRVLKTGRMITIDSSSGVHGYVYDGAISFEVVEHRLDKIPETRTSVMVNIGSPEEAFKNSYLPVKGVGLGRLEFIIASYIKIHPNALLEYSKLKREAVRDLAAKRIVRRIDELTAGYADKAQYYVDELAEGIAKIAAAFWPHEVIIRFSDFKTNEYRALIGGQRYEPNEENPMLGWRGASRYYDRRFKSAFGLECAALKKVRERMGLSNAVPMIPFCRTPEEGKQVISVMKENGLDKTADPTLKIYVMCEIPSNILRADEFLEIFDGMSIGSNDLTQLVLGLDRDSSSIGHIGNENDPALRSMLETVIAKCITQKKYIGICGQAPSDYPEFTDFLVEKGIESISLNPDVIMQTISSIAATERRIKNPQV